MVNKYQLKMNRIKKVIGQILLTFLLNFKLSFKSKSFEKVIK
jgi:hypothetical protein